MDEKKAALIKTIAILLSVTPETTLGRLLRLCLEAKVDREIAGKTALQIAREFVADPHCLPYWTQEVVGADGEFKTEEWKALGKLGIINIDEFLDALWAELEDIDL